MSDTLKIALTALAGVIVFVLGQVLVKLFIEPIQEQWKIRGQIIHSLSFYALLDNEKAPTELVQEWSRTLRTLASQLQGTTAIPAYKLLSVLRLVLSRENIFEISIYLVEMTSGDARLGKTISALIMDCLKMEGFIPASERSHRDIMASFDKDD